MKFDLITRTCRSSRPRWLALLLLGGCLTTLIGCGPSSSEPLATVTGTVTDKQAEVTEAGDNEFTFEVAGT